MTRRAGSKNDWRKLGYTVEELGEVGRVLHPPGCPAPRQQVPSPVEDPRRESLQQYLRFTRDFAWRVINLGPPSPQEYARIYRENRLEKLVPAVMEAGGPPLVCRGCFRLLQGLQRAYCSQRCRKVSTVRRYRERHPEHKLKRR